MISIAVRQNRPAWHLGILISLFCLAACPAWAAPSVSVRQPWFRYLLPSLPAGGYLTLHNDGTRAIRLVGARSTACGMMMLHKTVHEGGVEKMVAVAGVAIPAGGSFSFVPGAYHIMCMQPHMAVGRTVSVTLVFDHAAPLTAEFRVYGATGRSSGK